MLENQDISSKYDIHLIEGITEINFYQYTSVGDDCLAELQDLGLGFLFEVWLSFVKAIRYLFQVDKFFNDGKENKQNHNWIENPINNYKLCVTLEDQQQLNQINVITLNMWCLDPAQAFLRLQDNNTHSIVLTSGTMTPFSSWESELRIPFQIQESCGHVLDIQKNLIAGIVKQGQNGSEFNFGFKHRQNLKIYEELGTMLINMSDKIPNGVLVIFSSYSLLNKCRFIWAGDRETKILTRLDEKKLCFWEPQVSSEMEDIFQQYAKAARTQKGAIMFAVCRGKVAEGIDFSDELCRAVFIVGIPFPPFKDKKIELKKAYIDKIYNDKNINQFEKINSKQWYDQQAIRSANQAIGRVIRHKEDFGAIFLCDSRFEWQKIRCEISSWVQPVLVAWQSFRETYKSSENFFSIEREVFTKFSSNDKKELEQQQVQIFNQEDNQFDMMLETQSKKRNFHTNVYLQKLKIISQDTQIKQYL